MPGYEVFADDGTLVLRINRDDYSEIPEDEILEVALGAAPMKSDASPATKKDFQIQEKAKVDYEASIKDHIIDGKGVPTANAGVKHTTEEWLEKREVLNPGFSKEPEK